MKKIYEIKVYYKETSVDKVWVEVEAESFKDAKQQINEGNYDWMDSKNIDILGGEFIDEDEWEVTDITEQDTGSDSEEHN